MSEYAEHSTFVSTPACKTSEQWQQVETVSFKPLLAYLLLNTLDPIFIVQKIYTLCNDNYKSYSKWLLELKYQVFVWGLQKFSFERLT